jgi:hypothetical protein
VLESLKVLLPACRRDRGSCAVRKTIELTPVKSRQAARRWTYYVHAHRPPPKTCPSPFYGANISAITLKISVFRGLAIAFDVQRSVERDHRGALLVFSLHTPLTSAANPTVSTNTVTAELTADGVVPLFVAEGLHGTRLVFFSSYSSC